MSEAWIDRAWKDVLHENADDAISFFIPELAAERDYSKKPQSANPQHPVIGGDSNKGERTSDLCLSFDLKTGETSRAAFLVEQQHEEDKTLPLRMFQSYYRASDEYAIPVTSLAILTGGAKPINMYTSSWYGTSVSFTYNIYSVPRADAEELKRDKRIFAIPVLAAKRMLDAKGSAKKREEYSLELLGLTEARRLNEETMWSFKNFIHRILRIGDKDIDSKVREAWKMKFRPIDEVISDIRIRDAKEEVARNFLADGIPPDVVARNTGLELKDVQELLNLNI
jgi:hypothetical protein